MSSGKRASAKGVVRFREKGQGMMRRKLLWGLPAVAVVVVATLAISQLVSARAKVQVGGPCAATDRPSLAAVDHGALDALLQKYVDDRSLVAYAKWKGNADDVQALDQYLTRMGCVDLGKSAAKTAQLAYWINVYNALTIHGILREYPTTSIRNHTAKLGGYNIWKDLLLWVDGKNYSLDDIEHKILRKMGEPRIHVAIVCASIGCPPLANRAYTAKDLDCQLAANARRFFARPVNFRADERSQTVYVSELLKWYGTDFAPTPAEQMKALRPYFPSSETLSWIEETGVTVEYLDYNWGLNDQNPPPR
jgi:hypothetical protein